MSEKPGRHSDQFNLRLPDGMRDRIADAAKIANRSMNAEIVARLSRSLEEDSELPQMPAELLYPMAAAVAEQTVTSMLDAWITVAKHDGGGDLPSVQALRSFLAKKAKRDDPEGAN